MSTNKTIVKGAKQHKCSISLSELETKKSVFEFISDKSIIAPETYRDLVLFSPSKESHLGDKITNRLEKHIDDLVNEVISALDVKTIYFFSFYDSSKNLEDLAPKIITNNGTFMCLYCPDAFLESFYASIRNALAHGNIVKKGKYIYLYSVSSKEGKEVGEKERTLSFLLKVHKLNNLVAYIDAFKKYK
ncbi:MAG: hypothetical protein J5789_01555 [Oscillospiraceae bacterium]|nr:hypothetical protein [Oscillospiraceae bacterium]